MPACVDCYKYDSDKQICTVEKGSPIRKCVIALLDKELSTLTPNLNFLEVGCGSWNYAKNIVENRSCHWFGVEPRLEDEKGSSSIATHIGTVANLPFENNYFDYVLGNQTLEHWQEWKTSYPKGFRELYRVLKPGGILSMNVPIHLHGNKIFVKGDIHKVLNLFNPKLWKDLTYEAWRKDYEPLEPFEAYKLNGFDRNELISEKDIPSSWIMQIKVSKKGNYSQLKAFFCQALELYKWN